MQAAYVAAMMRYWADPAHNPTGSYGGPMVDMSRAHVWCWDARPFPAFPGRGDLWSDGPAWDRGHWLNGRAGAVPNSTHIKHATKPVLCVKSPAFQGFHLITLVDGVRIKAF